MSNDYSPGSNFIRDIVIEDLENDTYGGRVHTRFPPEPNGYLHIGHAKAIYLNDSIASEFNGKINLRFDDTNPIKEEQEFVNSIIEDVKWLGVDWEDRLYFASDYFEIKYEFACRLIKAQKAFVCDLSPEEIREYRGTLTAPGTNSPYRNRTVEENLDLFKRMKEGEFPEGARVLRAKIDMASGNLNMRDPVIYRILHASHHRTGDDWCIYPMYDFAHPFSDALEGITHSLCSIEWTDHRPLYNWIVEQALKLMPDYIKTRSRQYEFARLNITHTILSKRKLRKLVEGNFVTGWDDPRMPTISGIRRRGYTPAALRDFTERIGVARADSTVDFALLEHCIREELNKKAPRAMVVMRPLKVVITDYPEGKVEELEAVNNPEDPGMGSRKIPFAREIYIEKTDFMLNPPKKFFRLSPGKEVRLNHAYYITCQKVIQDEDTGEVLEVHCTHDPATRGGWSTDGRRVKGTLHWVSAAHAIKGDVQLFDTLFLIENPEGTTDEDNETGDEFLKHINPNSLEILKDCLLEPGLAEARKGDRYQFLRHGYFFVDPVLSQPGKPVFNRIVSLRDTWARIKGRTK